MAYSLHPLNSNFVWPESTQPAGEVKTEHLDAWNQQGYFLLKNCLSHELLQRVEDAIDPLEADAEAELLRRGGQHGISTAGKLTFTTHLVQRSKVLRDFARHLVFANLCQVLLGPTTRLYWDQAVFKKPGNPEEFPWHQDNGYTFVEPQAYLTCWVPLTRATIANGCPWVKPGVHKQGTLRHRLTPLGLQCFETCPDAEAIPAEVGDIVVFSSLTPHRTGPNLSDDLRKAYILQYAHGQSDVITREGERIPQENPERQFLITQDGRPVAETDGAG